MYHEVLAFLCPVPGRVIAAERQRGSTLFLTLHEVLAFSCPVPRRVIAAERQRGSTSVDKSGILSRDLGIFLSNWDFIMIFISKT